MNNLEISDVETALKEVAEHNGFDWDMWAVAFIRLRLEKILKEKQKK